MATTNFAKESGCFSYLSVLEADKELLWKAGSPNEFQP